MTQTNDGKAMPGKITVSFICDTNTALLLTTLYDLLTADVKDSVAAMTHLSWLVEEIATKTHDVLPILENETGDVSSTLKHLVASYYGQEGDGS